MKRREFIGNTLPSLDRSDNGSDPSKPAGSQDGLQKISKFANRTLPVVPRSSAGLEPYGGPWGAAQRLHLLRRTLFGVSPSVTSGAAGMSMNAIVAALVTDQPAPGPPLTYVTSDPEVPLGATWINAPTSDANGSRHNSLRAWWIGLMLGQGISLREKMTLFWHNHYSTETAIVKDARFSYRHNALLRQHAFGNFKTLTKAVTIDGAMLRYLNGNKNTAANPNENYARELQELFTIGKGPEIGPGNYTNYTEQDVQQAARVLTGWRDSNSTFVSTFTASRHDNGNKTFSSAYGNRVITGQAGALGAEEVDDLLDMIFDQAETARHICRKLYRWFVYYVIDAAAETNVITPMADLLRSGNYEVKPVLEALLKSAHFYDPINTGCMIKSPIDHTVGTSLNGGVAMPDGSDVNRQYRHWKHLYDEATTQQQQLGDPPNVAGWPAYYQEPQYYQMWINSDTLPNRTQFTDIQARTGFRVAAYTQQIDAIALAESVSSPGDPNVLIDELSGKLLAIAITPSQKTFLKDALIPGLPDYEWTTEWSMYMANPSDPDLEEGIRSKLEGLLGVMLSMPEYQLT